ncbi:DUF6919 domain-containing protein [Streptomyces melanosporofaciens]
MVNPWKKAESVADLGEFTAQWLEGRIRRHPGTIGRGGPDKETRHLVRTLAILNRAGFVTDCSQPGLPPQRGYKKRMFQQRAGVEGHITDQALLRRLTAAAKSAGLTVITYPPGATQRWGVPVTEVDGEPFTWFGNWFGIQDHIATSWQGVGEEALRELRTSTYLTLVDPVWGRDDRLWPALTGAIH